MAKTAVLVDGSFYLKMARKRWGEMQPSGRAHELHDYALSHITARRNAKEETERRELYRIFYYDCRPVTGRNVLQPWNGKNCSFTTKRGDGKWRNDFMRSLSGMRKVAMRLGELSCGNARFVPNASGMRKLGSGVKFADLVRDDFVMTGMKQEGVDMRIGLDVASLSTAGIVDQIVLIAGDSDFVPVMKYARRHGVDFILDPMGHPIHEEMVVQSDCIEDLSGDQFESVEDETEFQAGESRD